MIELVADAYQADSADVAVMVSAPDAPLTRLQLQTAPTLRPVVRCVTLQLARPAGSKVRVTGTPLTALRVTGSRTTTVTLKKETLPPKCWPAASVSFWSLGKGVLLRVVVMVRVGVGLQGLVTRYS